MRCEDVAGMIPSLDRELRMTFALLLQVRSYGLTIIIYSQECGQ